MVYWQEKKTLIIKRVGSVILSIHDLSQMSVSVIIDNFLWMTFTNTTFSDQFKGSFYPWFFPSALQNFVRLESPRFHEKNLSKRSLSFTHNKCSQLQPDISPLLFFVLAATWTVVLPGRTYFCLICGHASLPHCL